jgi:PGF-CTERM protein
MNYDGELMGLLLAGIMVLSAVPLASAGPVASNGQQWSQSAETAAEPEPADEIYVRENGSAVLVYESDSDTVGTPADVEYGADVSANLFYVLVSEPIEGETDVRGQASAALSEANISGDGQFSFDQPDSLSSLAVRLAGERTTENAESSFDLDMTVEEEGRASSELESASTSGNVTVTGSRFTTASALDVQGKPPAIGVDSGAASFVLTEDDGDYTVEVERNTTLSRYESQDYETRERARTTIEGQFGAIASSYNGSADVTIERYEYSETEGEQPRLDVAYTVEYTGIESELTEMLATELVEDESVEIDRARADELTTRMQDLTIERISAGYAADSDSVSAEFEADIRNYDDVVVPATELVGATDMESADAEVLQQLDDVRNRIEAMQAAELRRQLTWSASVSEPSPGRATVTASADYTTENWDDYVTELEGQGVEIYNTSYTASATTTETDRVEVAGSLSVDSDAFEEVTSQLLNSSADSRSDQSILRSILRADPQNGKVNVSADGDRIRLEVGAQFRNVTVIRDALAENDSVPAGVTSVVGRTDTGGTTTTYATIEDAVAADATESDVRALSYVDDETEVYTPGEWDREFPSMDTERAATFLGVEDPANTTATATGSSGPGFGVTAALLALVGVALLARRRT